MYVLVRLEVEDFERWKAAFDDRAGVRTGHGWQGGQVYTRIESDRRVVVLAEWDSAENAEAYFESTEFRRAMQDAGVGSKPEVTLLEHRADLAAEPAEGDCDDGTASPVE